MGRWRLTVAYDGTAYAGWQVQPNGLSVQEVLETALAGVTQEGIRVHGSGRTDAGVHARGQVFHFDTAWPDARVAECLVMALNAKLPPDVRVRDLRAVGATFHARFDAVSKEYRYRVWNGRAVSPFVRAYRTRVSEPLDRARMEAALERLVGLHDFAAFSVRRDDEDDDTRRRLLVAELLPAGGEDGFEEELCFRFLGEGFLYKMVRSLMGVVLDVGRGRYEPDIVEDLLACGERSQVVTTASAMGLFLWRVNYPESEQGGLAARNRSDSGKSSLNQGPET